MGQYHQIVNLSQRQAFSPRHTGNGVKLMEFGQDHGGAMSALWLLLGSEAWAGDRIAILGDYGDPEDLPTHVIEETGIDGGAWGDPDLIDVAEQARDLLVRRGIMDRYVAEHFGPELDPITLWSSVHNTDPTPAGCQVVAVNLDQHQHLDPAAFGDSRDLILSAATGGLGGVTTALAALLAAANKGGARGGGDLHSEDPLVGSWAGDHILVIPHDALASTSTDISPNLRDLLTAAGEGRYTTDQPDTITRVTPWGAIEDATPIA